MERDLSSKFFADKQELLMKYERQLEILRYCRKSLHILS